MVIVYTRDVTKANRTEALAVHDNQLYAVKQENNKQNEQSN